MTASRKRSVAYCILSWTHLLDGAICRLGSLAGYEPAGDETGLICVVVHVGDWQKFFHDEHFPIYGTMDHCTYLDTEPWSFDNRMHVASYTRTNMTRSVCFTAVMSSISWIHMLHLAFTTLCSSLFSVYKQLSDEHFNNVEYFNNVMYCALFCSCTRIVLPEEGLWTKTLQPYLG